MGSGATSWLTGLLALSLCVSLPWLRLIICYGEVVKRPSLPLRLMLVYPLPFYILLRFPDKRDAWLIQALFGLVASTCLAACLRRAGMYGVTGEPFDAEANDPIYHETHQGLRELTFVWGVLAASYFVGSVLVQRWPWPVLRGCTAFSGSILAATCLRFWVLGATAYPPFGVPFATAMLSWSPLIALAALATPHRRRAVRALLRRAGHSVPEPPSADETLLAVRATQQARLTRCSCKPPLCGASTPLTRCLAVMAGGMAGYRPLMSSAADELPPSQEMEQLGGGGEDDAVAEESVFVLDEESPATEREAARVTTVEGGGASASATLSPTRRVSFADETGASLTSTVVVPRKPSRQEEEKEVARAAREAAMGGLLVPIAKVFGGATEAEHEGAPAAPVAAPAEPVAARGASMPAFYQRLLRQLHEEDAAWPAWGAHA